MPRKLADIEQQQGALCVTSAAMRAASSRTHCQTNHTDGDHARFRSYGSDEIVAAMKRSRGATISGRCLARFHGFPGGVLKRKFALVVRISSPGFHVSRSHRLHPVLAPVVSAISSVCRDEFGNGARMRLGTSNSGIRHVWGFSSTRARLHGAVCDLCMDFAQQIQIGGILDINHSCGSRDGEEVAVAMRFSCLP